MKKLGMLLVLVSASMLTLGCSKPAENTPPANENTPAATTPAEPGAEATTPETTPADPGTTTETPPAEPTN